MKHKKEKAIWDNIFLEAKEAEAKEKEKKNKKNKLFWQQVGSLMYMLGGVVLSGAMYNATRYMLGYSIGIVAIFLMFYTTMSDAFRTAKELKELD